MHISSLFTVSHRIPSLRQSVNGFPKHMLQQSPSVASIARSTAKQSSSSESFCCLFTTSIAPAEGCCSTSSCELYKTPHSTVTDINSATVNRGDPTKGYHHGSQSDANCTNSILTTGQRSTNNESITGWWTLINVTYNNDSLKALWKKLNQTCLCGN